ncbi:hypothetical protein EMIHUDRAFT_113922 [Emiliania huxleyi CCMP1516]|uniref:Sialidase domain-containing protein n=2 Tax=Emiliania huxleyi TaxID=2903 RepID=A0A0D3JZV7_EMIH1|nr:hypothetical protein EMIHUDRAFT_113922 [Emiliania huxleyi CCMP1516]EOD29042.1 hypothetical protein EMIHUDRAFT_113922 [Emiliania huxleyi CCMP1516]|eukprot:XP_005781471.1 hypothetical protein EMIHUDRAFT_113922 [Emiliania huxleyi CCMP1516]
MTMLLLATLLSALTPPPDLTSTDLFTPGMPDTAGVTYACYRIPSMVWVANEASPHAVLLAFAEGRRGSCADKGDVRIVARRSSDGGQTWSSIEQVAVEAGHTIGNPAPVADLAVAGSVHLVHARDDTQALAVFLVSSADGGRSWSERRNLTAALKANPAPEAFVMPGPPGGVQLQSGRLVVGMYGEDEAKQVRSYAAFSDDHGRTWAHGSPAGTSASGPVYGGGENQIVPYGGGGTLAMFLRGRTTAADDVSHNHGLAWLNISGSYCEGSAVATPDGGLLSRRAEQPWMTSLTVVYFWPGFKATAPEMGYPVLQPVLQYGERGRAWALQSWFVDANDRRFPVATAPAVDVQPGDRITSYMRLSADGSTWTVSGTNRESGEDSTLHIAHSRAGRADYDYAMLVNENINVDERCDRMPAAPSLTFTNVTVNGHAKPAWATRADCHGSPRCDCGNAASIGANGDVTLSWSTDPRSRPSRRASR